jgi:hypothetical protein
VLWHEAYANIYANQGATTPGVDGTTLDGFSQERVASIITRLKAGRTASNPCDAPTSLRKMKDVARGKQLWQQMMAARRRKTLILCTLCHQRLHAGTLPDRTYLKQYVKGEPDAFKGARPVLRELRHEVAYVAVTLDKTRM